MERRARMARAEAPESAPDPTAATEAAELELPPEIVAQSLGQWFRGWMVRIRSGDSGVLPVILGLVIITLVFEAVSPHNLFLSAGNLVNLFQQSAVIMVLAMAEIFALLLGEIDLSVGYVGAVGGVAAVPDRHPGRPPGLQRLDADLAVVGTVLRLSEPGRPQQQPPGAVQVDVGRDRSDRELDRYGRRRRPCRLSPLVRRLPPAAQRSRGAPGQPDADEDRADRDCFCRRRWDLQHQPGQYRRGRGRALGHPDRPFRLRRMDAPTAANSIRPLRLCHWRQSGGGAPSRYQARGYTDLVLCPVLAHRGHRRYPLCLLPGRDVEQRQWRPARPLRSGGGGHRRNEPFWRPGQSAARAAGGSRRRR